MEIKDEVLTTSHALGKIEGGEGSIENGHPHLLQLCKREVTGGNLQLPVDILIEILSRVPGSDLIRFRLVCKLFYNLTRNHSLVDLHLERARGAIPPSVLIFSKAYSETNVNLALLDNDWVPKYSYQLPVGRGHCHMTPSCNGIVCIYDDNGYVQLLNPTTRERLILPEPTRVAKTHFYPNCYFGFHPGTNKYKILRYFSFDGNQFLSSSRFQFHCEVLTVGDGSWRRISDIGFLPHEDGVAINGTVFWLVRQTDSIVAINLDDEKFVLHVPLPDKDHICGLTFIAEVEGSACFAFSRFGTQGVLEIWILKDVANRVWMQMYCIDIERANSLVSDLACDFCYVTPMFFDRKKLLLGFKNILCCFDLQSKDGSFEIIYRTEFPHGARIHVESLVSLRDL